MSYVIVCTVYWCTLKGVSAFLIWCSIWDDGLYSVTISVNDSNRFTSGTWGTSETSDTSETSGTSGTM